MGGIVTQGLGLLALTAIHWIWANAAGFALFGYGMAVTGTLIMGM